MTATDYKDLLYKVAQELRRDPEVDMGRLKFIAEDKMSPERVAEIHDELSWIKELDASGSIRMDNLDYLKEILQTLEKRACLGKVLSFETKRRSATLAFQPTGSSGAIVRAFAGRLLGGKFHLLLHCPSTLKRQPRQLRPATDWTIWARIPLLHATHACERDQIFRRDHRRKPQLGASHQGH